MQSWLTTNDKEIEACKLAVKAYLKALSWYVHGEMKENWKLWAIT